jgi:hypothetical protein
MSTYSHDNEKCGPATESLGKHMLVYLAMWIARGTIHGEGPGGNVITNSSQHGDIGPFLEMRMPHSFILACLVITDMYNKRLCNSTTRLYHIHTSSMLFLLLLFLIPSLPLLLEEIMLVTTGNEGARLGPLG